MFARHSLVWLTAAGWQASRDSVAPGCHAILERWQRADWPVIARRVEPGTGSGQVCLGIPLPPDPVTRRKERIAFHAPVCEVSRSGRPLTIDTVLASAPARWQDALAALAAEAGRHDLMFEVYGSLALQALTAASYVTESSDIDILFSPTTRLRLQWGISLLRQYAKRLPLDGEILFPAGQAVAWKEWVQSTHAGGNSRVLVKESAGVHLSPTAALMISLAAPEAATCTG